MTSYARIVPDPQLIPERDEWLAECPTCGGLSFGVSPEDALWDWREHNTRAHVAAHPGGDRRSAWTITDLRTALHRFESEVRRAGLAESVVSVYLNGSEGFVRWLAGESDLQDGR